MLTVVLCDVAHAVSVFTPRPRRNPPRRHIQIVCLLFALPVLADRVEPTNPTNGSFVRYYVVSHSGCGYYENVTIDGYTITIELLYQGGSCTSAVTDYRFGLGYLRPGMYNVTVYFWDRTLPPRTSTFVVASASPTIPTLTEWGITALILSVSVLGIFALRTRSP